MKEVAKTMEQIKTYSLQELADILKVSRQTIYNHMKAGHIEAIRVGREYRIREDELQRILAEGFRE